MMVRRERWLRKEKMCCSSSRTSRGEEGRLDEEGVGGAVLDGAWRKD